MGVEAQQERVVQQPLTAGVAVGDAVAVEEHRDGLGEIGAPVLVGHLGAVGGEPGDVAQPVLAAPSHRLAGEEPAPAEHRVLGAQRRHHPGEGQQVHVRVGPVDPGELVVLAVAVVVAVLGAAQLVAVTDHRHALRQQQRGQEIALLAGPQGVDLLVVGRSLGAAVPGPVVALAVVVVLAVGLVVLLVVGHQVTQREPVVGGDEVDRGDRPAPGVFVQVGRTGQPVGELVEGGGSPRQKSRTVSRYLPFHSVHCGGKLPTW